MSFEKTLTYVAEESIRKNYSSLQMKELFQKYLPVLSLKPLQSDHGKVHTFTLPAPKLWHRYGADSDSIYWVVNDNNKEMVKERMKYWKGTGEDGLMNIVLKQGHGKSLIDVQFEPYFRIPKNALAVDGCAVFHGEKGTLLDHVWVYPRSRDSHVNHSVHGYLACNPESGFTYFSPKDDNLHSLNVRTSVDDAKIASFSMQVIDPQWENLREFMHEPVLGDGTLTALLKHLQYDKELDSLVKESSFI